MFGRNLTKQQVKQLLGKGQQLTSSSYGSNGQYLIPKLAVF